MATRRLLAPGRVLALFLLVLSLSIPPTIDVTLASPIAAGAFPPLTVNATATPSTGGIPLTVAFNATAHGGQGPYSYNWSFGDGSANGTTPAINHTFRWVATFSVNVTAVDQLGEFVTRNLLVVATPAPFAVGLSAIPSALAAGSTTYLLTSVAGGTSPYSFAWSGLPAGCPAQPVKNLSCTPEYGGSYVVTVSVTDANGLVQSATLGLVVTGSGPLTPPPTAPRPPDFTWAIIAVVALGAAAVVAAAYVGRTARRRRERGPA